MERPLLLLEAQMQAPKWRSDDSATITLVTSKEISNEQFLALSQYKKVLGFMAFKGNKFDPGELPKENAVVKGMKTKSQVLRDHLFALHMQTGGTEATFPAYYDQQMDKVIQAVKDQLLGR